MDLLLAYAPWLVAMVVLILCSAFFSSSEAACFYLRSADRRRLASGNQAQRMVARLLDEPDRLLTAVLFWNLVVNLAYFTIASIVSLQLEPARPTTAERLPTSIPFPSIHTRTSRSRSVRPSQSSTGVKGLCGSDTSNSASSPRKRAHLVEVEPGLMTIILGSTLRIL